MSTEDSNQQEDLSITPMSDLGHSDKANMIISELNSIYGRSKDKIGELIEVLRQEDKLNDKQIKAVLLNEVRFISRTTIYEALPDYMKRTYTKTPKALDDQSGKEHSKEQYKQRHDIMPNRQEQSVPDTDTEIDRPVYREPDLVAPVLGDKTLAQVLEDKNIRQEQQFNTKTKTELPKIQSWDNTMHSVPVVDDYRTIVTNLRVEIDNANLDLPVTVRVYDSGKIELMTFTCNQIMLKGDQ